jgi:hypothetical protein
VVLHHFWMLINGGALYNVMGQEISADYPSREGQFLRVRSKMLVGKQGLKMTVFN